MNRFKINALISVFIIISFLSCLGVSTSASKKYCEKNFSDSSSFFYDNIEKALRNNYLPEEYTDGNLNELSSLDELVFNMSRCAGDPYVIGIYNDKCELAVRSDILIKAISYNAEKGKYDFAEIINIGDYISDEIKEEIREYSNNSSNNIEIIRVDYSEDEGALIPVNLYFHRHGVSPHNYKKFTLTDRKITGSYFNDMYDDFTEKEKKNCIEANLEINYYDLFENKGNTRLFNQLNDELSSIDVLSDIAESVKDGISRGYGGLDEMYFTFGNVYVNGSYYAVYFHYTHNILNDILHSSMFKGMLRVELYIFALMAVVLFVICNKYYTKSVKLANARQAFVSAAAHELKTPIAAISSHSECIMENIAPDKNDKYIRTIHSESQRMNKLVASLLQYNRLALLTQIDKSKCSLSDIVENELEQYDTLVDQKGIILESNILPYVIINANEDLIALVVDNFLSNAVKHTESGCLISVTLEAYKKGYKLTVFNEGSTIDKETESNLWDILYRSDKARNSKDNSTGMGLAICKQILELHKAKYGFKNKDNGVEFFFIIK